MANIRPPHGPPATLANLFTPIYRFGDNLTWDRGPQIAYPYDLFPSISPNPYNYTVPSPAYVAGGGVNADLLLSGYANRGHMPF